MFFNRYRLRFTGDYAVSKDGHLFFSHRKDEQIKRFGKRIDLNQISSLLIHHLQASDCQLLVYHDETMHIDLLLAFLVDANNDQASLDILEPHQNPDYVIPIDLMRNICTLILSHDKEWEN